MDQFSELNQFLENRIEKNIELSQYSTFKIGGAAKFFYIAKTNEDLLRAVTFAKKLKIKHFILGGGSNLLISDQGYDGLVIKIETSDLIFKDNNLIVADSGLNLQQLVNKTAEKGLKGLEWAAGIPGTVGGAVRGNAGAYGGQISDNLTGVEVMKGSKQFIIKNEKINFGYRDSIFKHNNDTIITAEFKLEKGNREEIKNKISEILQDRKEKQPLEYPSAGCIFKNIILKEIDNKKIQELNIPEQYLKIGKLPAAWLIDYLDLKGKTIGDARISKKHANFIVNLGKATASDVVQLISLVKMKARDELGIQLQEEIQYVGF